MITEKCLKAKQGRYRRRWLRSQKPDVAMNAGALTTSLFLACWALLGTAHHPLSSTAAQPLKMRAVSQRNHLWLSKGTVQVKRNCPSLAATGILTGSVWQMWKTLYRNSDHIRRIEEVTSKFAALHMSPCKSAFKTFSNDTAGQGKYL